MAKYLLDSGAVKALKNGKKFTSSRKLSKLMENFLREIILLIVDQSGNDSARGIVSFSSDEINKVKGLKSDQLESILGYPTKSEIIHRR